MNSDQFSGQWHQIKGGIRAKWGKLTDDDMEMVQGNREKLVGKIQSRYGKTKEEAKSEVNSYIDSL
ncbi:CsbD family protein [Teredinibacter turnerae]|uniref:CsbD family protein n=1 Tax=Teredinibacter turnerae (strain ATCC 39867 / T7901) TaxID=377629 RepID=C5BI96_TERTT|nr:CsbD family protein [Teredinibacter turnerae]ACR11087.1 CsbD family protein [Teredinibacter turnerae T7901]